MNTLTWILPAILCGLLAGRYVVARRIEYKLAMDRLKRMEISRTLNISTRESKSEREHFLTFVRCLRTIQATVIFRRLVRTGVQRRVLIKVLEDYGRRYDIGASLISEAIILILPAVESWLLRHQTKEQRTVETLKVLFVPERFK